MEYTNNVGLANVSTKGYIASLIKQKVATVAAEVATVALNAAISLGLSAAITGAIALIDNLVHAEEKAAEAAKKTLSNLNEQIEKYDKISESSEKLIKDYEELEKSYNELNSIQENKRTVEQNEQLVNLSKEMKTKQEEITSFLKEQRQYTSDLVGNYDGQFKKVKEIYETNLKNLKVTQEAAIIAAKQATKSEEFTNFFGFSNGPSGFDKKLKELGFDENYFSKIDSSSAQRTKELYVSPSTSQYLDNLTSSEQVKALEEMIEKLTEGYNAGEDYGEIITFLNEKLGTLKETHEKVSEEIQKYMDIIDDEVYNEVLDTFDESVDSAEDFKELLESINDMPLNELRDVLQKLGINPNNITSLEDLRDRLITIAKESYPDFIDSSDKATKSIEEQNKIIKVTFSELGTLADGYNTLKEAVSEFNNSGKLSYETMNNLINNNLLQYLDLTSDKVAINEAAFANAATAMKANAMYQVAAEAATQMAAVAYGEEAGQVQAAANSTSGMTTKTQGIYNKLVSVIPKILEGANAWKQYRSAMGDAFDNLNDEQKDKIQNIVNNAASLTNKINNMTIKSVSYSRATAKSSKSSKNTNSSLDSAEKKAEEKRKKQYEKRLKYFTNTIDKMESKEEEWVNKQKSLGLLSNSDMIYVTKRRIKEYEKYLDKIKKATWMNKEDRKKLQDEYTKKLKESQLDYFEYLKGKLDDEVKAIEEARDKKIKALEEETDKKIELLKKEREAEKETNERQEILDDIAYWEQRTGREAIENLAEARKKLAEFDRDAQIEAQIEALEENEKNQKASIERQAQNQIDALQKVYNAQVKAFSESNKIIYEDSKIAAKNLYNAYKKNFVEPLKDQLKFINKKEVKYTVKKGDTLNSIAKEIAKSTGEKKSTIIKRIKSANSSLKNTKNTAKLKKGLKIKIPMFHQGGIFSGTEEGLALLKKGEWVLRPEWSTSLNRMMKYFDNATQKNVNPINSGPNIEVEGNLVNIQATVRNQSDIDAIGKKVEKILKEKFNIKK